MSPEMGVFDTGEKRGDPRPKLGVLLNALSCLMIVSATSMAASMIIAC